MHGLTSMGQLFKGRLRLTLSVELKPQIWSFMLTVLYVKNKSFQSNASLIKCNFQKQFLFCLIISCKY